MHANTSKLLEPISPAELCGPDLSYDPLFDELEAILKGKPEVEIGEVKKPAEPPEWRELKNKSAEFLRRSKHLKVAMIYSCSLLKTEGLIGFVEGLQLIRGLLEQQWLTLYPQLDPTDANDPTQRLNILGVLNAVGGPFAGWLTTIDNLYSAEVIRLKGAPPVTFRQLIDAVAKIAGAPDAAKLTADIRKADGEMIIANSRALEESLTAVRGIDEFLTTTIGSGNTISFEVIEKTLRELLKSLQPLLPGGVAVQATTENAKAAANVAGGISSAVAGISIQGSIQSRTDVVEAIDRICDYYKQVEPGSPVPFLLKRAQKLAMMDFVQAVQELNLATVEALRPSMGSAVESPPVTPVG